MANPNIVNVVSIYGNTTYLIPSTTSATVWSDLTPAVGTLNKINNIVASNVTASVAEVTVSINSGTNGGGTAYRIAKSVNVPAKSSLIIVDKATSFYCGESQSIVVTVDTANAIELISSYEALTE